MAYKTDEKISKLINTPWEVLQKRFDDHFTNDVCKMLEDKGIEYTVEVKENCGKIAVFYLKGKKVFTYSFRKGKLDVFYYSEEDACNSCRIRF